MIKRWQESGVLSTLKCRRAVNLAGARQCGKTTLAMSLPLSSSRHFTLDDAKIAEVARNDPSGFVNRAAGETLIIDEIQKIPELLNSIKINVDRSDERGQYLFTGSANLHFVKAVTDSLAGRVGRVRLRTLSLGEINGASPDFLAAAFERRFPSRVAGCDKRTAISLATRGGYPETVGMDVRERRGWTKGAADWPKDPLGMHINDVVDKNDDHFAPGMGKVDFAALKDMATATRHVVFEPSAAVEEEDLVKGLHHLKALWA